MTMGDRVAVMRKGELQQVAEPQVLYDRPLNLFVGGFIGSPAMNMLAATIERSNGSSSVVLGDQRLELDPELVASRPALQAYEGRPLIVGIRPEHLDDATLAPGTPPGRRLRGTVELREALGSELMVHFTVDGAKLADTDETKELAHDTGADAEGLKTSGALFIGRFGARAHVTEGEPVEVAVDTSALHFFDVETGLGIYDRVQEKGAAS
jgi:multiple sugar transport system ATP-binding protein